ncbi:MAG: hypothetical protein KBC95_04035 [Candidatus Peribacteraceae bacterium]|nr:hypothetical protein [Candidatus Peribacteraceae bacterium]
MEPQDPTPPITPATPEPIITPPPVVTPPPAAPASVPAPIPLTPEEDIAKNKDLAALSYLWILSVFVYFLKKDSPFVRFHARQGMTLFGLSVLFMIVPVISRPLQLLILVGCAFGFMNAAQGKRADLPLIAALSRADWKKLRSDWQDAVAVMGRFWHSIMDHMPKGSPHAAPKTDKADKPAEAKPATPAPTPSAPAQTVTPATSPVPSAPPSTPDSHGV